MPKRSCAGCRRVREKRELVRLASRDGVLVADSKGTQSGRGVYVCPDGGCLREAYKRKELFSRALRCKLTVPPEQELLESVTGVKPC